MKKFFCALSLLFLTSFTPASQDMVAIVNLSQEFGAAWNRHDAKALAALWTTDGDLLSPWRPNVINGRNEIEKHFEEEYSDKMSQASLQFTIKNIRLIDPEIAFVDADFVISGMVIGGIKSHPFSNHSIFVLVKRDGKWQILAARPY